MRESWVDSWGDVRPAPPQADPAHVQQHEVLLNYSRNIVDDIHFLTLLG